MSKQSLEEAVKLHNTLAYNLKVSVLSQWFVSDGNRRIDACAQYVVPRIGSAKQRGGVVEDICQRR